MNFYTSNSKSGKLLQFFGLCFVSATIVFFGLSELLLRKFVVPQDELTKHVELFASSEIGNAAFGDSHVARGFVPPAHMLNLGYPSESLPQMDWKIRTFYKSKEPGLVVLQADPHMFAPYRLTRKLGDYPEIFENKQRNAKSILHIFEDRYRANLVNYWIAFATNYGKLVSKIEITDNGAHLSPGNLVLKHDRIREYEAKIRVNTHDIQASASFDEYKNLYSELLNFLTQNGANLCLVSFPLSPDYNAALAQRDLTTRNTLIEFFTTESRRVNAAYVNLMDDIEDLSKFRDTDHLNGKAAIEVSSEIMHLCFG